MWNPSNRSHNDWMETHCFSPTSIKSSVLELSKVTCTFAPASDDGRPYTAVSETSLSIAAGEFVSVVGPTGCGKSTLLNIAAGLIEPSSGSVRVHGQALEGINKFAGYLFQTDALMPWRNAIENVRAGLEFRGLESIEADGLAREWLQRVGLIGFDDRYPYQLSGGMRKRVALAQMLILDPKILLMDEPFSALDVQTRQLMENELLELWSANRKSVLFVTHDLEEAIALSDRIIILSAGPETHPIGDFRIDLPRPRDVAEIRLHPAFLPLHSAIWQVLKSEVLKGYAQTTR